MGVLFFSELAALRARGLVVTEFTREIPLHGPGLDAAIDTIKEHYPCSPIWVEHVTQL